MNISLLINQVKDQVTFGDDGMKTDVSLEYMSDYSKLEVIING